MCLTRIFFTWYWYSNAHILFSLTIHIEFSVTLLFWHIKPCASYVFIHFKDISPSPALFLLFALWAEIVGVTSLIIIPLLASVLVEGVCSSVKRSVSSALTPLLLLYRGLSNKTFICEMSCCLTSAYVCTRMRVCGFLESRWREMFLTGNQKVDRRCSQQRFPSSTEFRF